MARTTTWEAWNGKGALPPNAYAFPNHRLEPLTNICEVSNAIERLSAHQGVTDDDRSEAFRNIKKAAKHFHVELHGDTYDEVCRRPQELMMPRD